MNVPTSARVIAGSHTQSSNSAINSCLVLEPVEADYCPTQAGQRSHTVPLRDCLIGR